MCKKRVSNSEKRVLNEGEPFKRSSNESSLEDSKTNLEYVEKEVTLLPSDLERRELDFLNKELHKISPIKGLAIFGGWLRGKQKALEHPAEAYLNYMIIPTPLKKVHSILNDLGVSQGQYPLFTNTFDFYTVRLDLSIVMNDPESWSLIFARFRIELLEESAKIIKIIPREDGIQAAIRRYGSRTFSIDTGLEFGPSLGGITPKSSNISASFKQERGWEVTYSECISDIIGATLGRGTAMWDIYGNKTFQVSGDIPGKTIIACTAMHIMINKGEKTDAIVKSDGKVKKERLVLWDKISPIIYIGPECFKVPNNSVGC